jgi:hypothetical protein
MASIGSGFAWPALEFASDGEFVQLQAQSEAEPDVAAIRYLRDVAIDVPAAEFEAAVDRFAEAVEGRLASTAAGHQALLEVRRELADERSDVKLRERRKWEALAGLDSGEAAEDWFAKVEDLKARTGATAVGEVMAVTPQLENRLETAAAIIEAIRGASTVVDLAPIEAMRRAHPQAVHEAGPDNGSRQLPWQRGAALASDLRRHLGIHGRLENKQFQHLLGITLPVPREGQDRQLAGALRRSASPSKATLAVPSSRPESQRFYFARLIACAMVAPGRDRLLPITSASTALQKLERAFAQELLCPWHELHAFTNQHGVDGDGIVEAAEHFEVSQLVVLTTLVNKKKVPRARLPLP